MNLYERGERTMKRLTALILSLAAIFFAGTETVCAKTWITVSEWAYNDVSNFKKEGLLPESLENTEDFTLEITRLQFAEILDAVMERKKDIYDVESCYIRPSDVFADTDNAAANRLFRRHIMCGELNEEGLKAAEENYYFPKSNSIRYLYIDHEDSSKYYSFYPDKLLTREEMAAVMYRAAVRMLRIYDVPETRPADYDELPDWAKHDAGSAFALGLLVGDEDGRLNPEKNLTIEEAICAVYRLYEKSKSILSDGVWLDAETETTVQTYENGITETKEGNILRIKENGNVLMEFETDVYSNIYCATRNGTVYAAAQTCDGRTDVYDARTKELLFKIPHCVAELCSDYIYTRTSELLAPAFGLSDYSGGEVLPPIYSREEIDTLKRNGFIRTEEERQAANGWIYYIDADDDSHLYRIDTNGENKQKLSDERIARFEYIKDFIYYRKKDDKNLYRMLADGKLCENITSDEADSARLVYANASDMAPNVRSGFNFGVDYVYYDDRNADKERPRFLYDDDWVYYTEEVNGGRDTQLCRISAGSGETKKEKVFEDYKARELSIKNGNIYFTDMVRNKEDKDNIYRFDLYVSSGGEPRPVAENVSLYGFYQGESVVYLIDETWYIADKNGEHSEIWQEAAEAYAESKRLETEPRYTIKEVEHNISDDKYKVYYEVSEYETEGENQRDVSERYVIADSAGNERAVDYDDVSIPFRIGDVLYMTLIGKEHTEPLIAYDMNTGTSRLIADNVDSLYGKCCAFGEEWFTYSDEMNNIWRYDVRTGVAAEIFPNANTKRYGKAYKMLGLSNGMYKVDADGNYSLISQAYAANCRFVKDGADEGENF